MNGDLQQQEPDPPIWIDNDHFFCGTGLANRQLAFLVDIKDRTVKPYKFAQRYSSLLPNPTAKTVAYTDDNGLEQNQLYLVDLASGKRTILNQQLGFVQGMKWDIAGKQLAIITNNKIVLFEPDKESFNNANDGTLTYVNEKYGFSLVFPSYWQDQYNVEDVRGIGLRIHHRNTWLKNGAGTLCQITVFDKSMDDWSIRWTGLMKGVGIRKIFEDDKELVGLSTPTDVQYTLDDNKLSSEYMQMENDVFKFAETFKKISNDNSLDSMPSTGSNDS